MSLKGKWEVCERWIVGKHRTMNVARTARVRTRAQPRRRIAIGIGEDQVSSKVFPDFCYEPTTSLRPWVLYYVIRVPYTAEIRGMETAPTRCVPQRSMNTAASGQRSKSDFKSAVQKYKSVLCCEMRCGVSQRRARLPVPTHAVTALAGELARHYGFPTAAPAVPHSRASWPCDPAHVLARPASATGGLEGP